MIVLSRRISEPGTRVVSGTVTLDVDSRIKSRLRVTLDDGREAGLMLERGHLLRGGELLADAEGTQLIRVLAAPRRCRRCAVPIHTCWPAPPTTWVTAMCRCRSNPGCCASNTTMCWTTCCGAGPDGRGRTGPVRA